LRCVRVEGINEQELVTTGNNGKLAGVHSLEPRRVKACL
jgi:hypothetical protein